MSIILNPETQRLLAERMRKDGFATADDLVHAALASLDQQKDSEEFDPGELDRLLDKGERSGESIDGESVLAELRALQSKCRDKAG